jgi:hypothetical protein
VDKYTPFQSLLLHHFYKSFMDKLKDSEIVPADLENAKHKSKELHEEIQAALKMGKNCQNQAKWIGLNGYAVFQFMPSCHFAQLLYLAQIKNIGKWK